MGAAQLDRELDLVSDIDTDEAYNPLDFIEGDDDDWGTDEERLLPEALPPDAQEHVCRPSVYSPERAGSVGNAVRNLVTTNAARRHILLSIIDWARDGVPADTLFSLIEQEQTDNLSVYDPVSYCRMLERAGALCMETPSAGDGEPDMPETAGTVGEEDPQVGYLTIDGDIKPFWRSTEDGLHAYDELTQGTEWRDKVLGEDSVYAEVYLAVMGALDEQDRTRGEIVELAESFEVTKHPRKYGTYFIDVLEATSAIRWTNSAWTLTDLGRQLLDELGVYCAGASAASTVTPKED